MSDEIENSSNTTVIIIIVIIITFIFFMILWLYFTSSNATSNVISKNLSSKNNLLDRNSQHLLNKNKSIMDDKSGLVINLNSNSNSNLNSNSNSNSNKNSNSRTGKGLSPKLGNLYQDCPCRNGLVCDNGICKLKTGSSCVISSTCLSKDICYLGKCIPKPSHSDEIKKTNFVDIHDDDYGQICLNRHFLILNDKTFSILPGWWKINDCVSLCESDRNGSVYVVSEQQVYRVTINTGKMASDPDIKRIDQDLSVAKIFRFVTKIHVLTNQGKIYQLISENSNQWEYRRITQIYKKDISNSIVDDIFVSDDSKVSIKIDGKVWAYPFNLMKETSGSDEYQWKFLKGVSKVSYNNRNFYDKNSYDEKILYDKNLYNRKIFYDQAYLYSDRIVIHFKFNLNKDTWNRVRPNNKINHNNHNNHKLTIYGKFKNMVFNTINTGIIAISDSYISEYVFVYKNRGPTYTEHKLNGIGDNIFNCHNHIWLLTGYACSSF